MTTNTQGGEMEHYVGVCPGCGSRIYATEDEILGDAIECSQCDYVGVSDEYVDEAIRVDGVDG